MNNFKNWLQGYLEDKLEPQQVDKILQKFDEERDQFILVPSIEKGGDYDVDLYKQWEENNSHRYQTTVNASDAELITKFIPNKS